MTPAKMAYCSPRFLSRSSMFFNCSGSCWQNNVRDDVHLFGEVGWSFVPTYFYLPICSLLTPIARPTMPQKKPLFNQSSLANFPFGFTAFFWNFDGVGARLGLGRFSDDIHSQTPGAITSNNPTLF